MGSQRLGRTWLPGSPAARLPIAAPQGVVQALRRFGEHRSVGLYAARALSHSEQAWAELGRYRAGSPLVPS